MSACIIGQPFQEVQQSCKESRREREIEIEGGGELEQEGRRERERERIREGLIEMESSRE